jgi:hypothetical protein
MDDRRHPRPTTVAMSAEVPFIEYGGRIVAIAGRTRCYIAVDDLDAATPNFVAVMCLCKREIDEGRIEGPFNSELAARWARLVMIGPHNIAREGAADDDIAQRLHVPIEQVRLARQEFGYMPQPLHSRFVW